MKKIIISALISGAALAQSSNIDTNIRNFNSELVSFERLISSKKIAVTGKARFLEMLDQSLRQVNVIRDQTLSPILTVGPDFPVDISLKGSEKVQYVFPLFQDCLINFRTIGSSNFNFKLYNSQNRLVLDRSVSTLDEQVELPADRYKILFTNRSSSSTTFSFVAAVVPDPVDPTDPTDPGSFLTIGSSRPGYIKSGGEEFYQFKVNSSKTLSIYTASSIDTYLEVFDKNGSKIASDDDSGSGRNALIRRSFSPGVYEIKVRGYSSSVSGNYSINLE
jgi:hypothetical protein